jgi:ketosteroid isomerase-like protein
MKSEEQKILVGVGEWTAAMLSNDAKRIGSFLTDDWVLVSERGIATKEHFLSFVESGALRHESIEAVGEPRLRVYGDAAVLTTRIKSRSYFAGKLLDDEDFSTTQLVKIERQWLAVLTHVTAVNKEFQEMIAGEEGQIKEAGKPASK